MGSNPGYLLKSFLLYLEMVLYIYLNFCVLIFFPGSADIKTLLPVETSRFVSISTEFLTLMKKVSRSPMVMDVLNIQNGQKSLERLADLLAKIQKALGEYLERERASFPRFYFVGDEDLLEIIGNTKNIPRYLCALDPFLEKKNHINFRYLF